MLIDTERKNVQHVENFNHLNYLPMSDVKSINVIRLEITLY